MTGSHPRRRTPHGPFVLDTRELGRRPGSMRHVRSESVLTADLGTEMMWVPAGASATLDLRLESVIEGVLISGTVEAPLRGECARCLDDVADVTTVELRELFYYPERAVDLGDDEDARVLVDDHADIEPVVRDALVLSLPLSPTCHPDCAGLCVDCGVRLDDVEPGHSHTRADPRWSALSVLAPADSTGSVPGRTDPREIQGRTGPDENKEKK